MMQSVTQRPRARIDLLEQFVYFGEEALSWPSDTLPPRTRRVPSWSNNHGSAGLMIPIFLS